MGEITTPWPAGGIDHLPVEQQRRAVLDQLFRMFLAAKSDTPEADALMYAHAEIMALPRIPSEAC